MISYFHGPFIAHSIPSNGFEDFYSVALVRHVESHAKVSCDQEGVKFFRRVNNYDIDAGFTDSFSVGIEPTSVLMVQRPSEKSLNCRGSTHNRSQCQGGNAWGR